MIKIGLQGVLDLVQSVLADGQALGSDGRFDVAAGDAAIASQGRGAADVEEVAHRGAGLSALGLGGRLWGLRHNGGAFRHVIGADLRHFIDRGFRCDCSVGDLAF